MNQIALYSLLVVFSAPSILNGMMSSKAKEAPKDRQCAVCEKSPTRGECEKLQKCSQCQAIHYCSKACQKADWPDHKVSCKPPKKASEFVEPENARRLQQQLAHNVTQLLVRADPENAQALTETLLIKTAQGLSDTAMRYLSETESSYSLKFSEAAGLHAGAAYMEILLKRFPSAKQQFEHYGDGTIYNGMSNSLKLKFVQTVLCFTDDPSQNARLTKQFLAAAQNEGHVKNRALISCSKMIRQMGLMVMEKLIRDKDFNKDGSLYDRITTYKARSSYSKEEADSILRTCLGNAYDSYDTTLKTKLQRLARDLRIIDTNSAETPINTIDQEILPYRVSLGKEVILRLLTLFGAICSPEKVHPTEELFLYYKPLITEYLELTIGTERIQKLTHEVRVLLKELVLKMFKNPASKPDLSNFRINIETKFTLTEAQWQKLIKIFNEVYSIKNGKI